MLTWQEIVELEPALLETESRVRAAATGYPGFCRRKALMGAGAFDDLHDRVGFWRSDLWPHYAELATDEAYYMALHHLRSVLPTCDHGFEVDCLNDEAY